jgi:hypothetical protein
MGCVQALGVSVEELLKRSVAAYLPQAQAELPFEPIGFGMWAGRPEMQDVTKWIDDLREREWIHSMTWVLPIETTVT